MFALITVQLPTQIVEEAEPRFAVISEGEVIKQFCVNVQPNAEITLAEFTPAHKLATTDPVDPFCHKIKEGDGLTTLTVAEPLQLYEQHTPEVLK